MCRTRAPTKEISFDTMDKYLYIDTTSPSGLRRKIKRKQCNIGDVAGRFSKYWQVTVEGKLYMASRIVYCLYHKGISSGVMIDHVDGDKGNNRIENLRTVDVKINGRNRKLNINSATGIPNISRVVIANRSGGYNEYIRVDLGLPERVIKQFNIKTFGEELALQLAINYKSSMKDLLINNGYTERHLNGTK